MPSARAARFRRLAFLVGLLAPALPGCRRPSPADAPHAAADGPSTATSTPAPEVFRFSPRPNRAAEIRWSGWSAAAFARARAEHRPVLLSLAAIWCHWCHVLDETTLSDPRVIARLNADFVPLRVDADQRPDVEERYLAGGWPTLAFLDDAGEVIEAGTYVPPERFVEMADRALGAYRRAPTDPSRSHGSFDPTNSGRGGALDAVVEGVARALGEAADPVNGGFGRGQKFPSGEAVLLLLEAGERELAARSMTAMLRLEDPVEGGFYRYATRPDWSAPHYEKMLAVQADLIAAAAHAGKVLGDRRDTEAARRGVAWLRRTLTAPDGSFYASQDADERYYALDAAGRTRHAASGAPLPPIDRTLLVDRNARMILALLSAARDLDDASLVSDAGRAARALLPLVDGERGGIRHARRADGAVVLSGNLADQAWAAWAFAEVARAGGDPDGALRGAAQALIEWTGRRLFDPRGGYWDLPEEATTGPDAQGLLRRRDKLLEPNVAMARALLATGDASGARRTLSAFAGSYPMFGTEAAAYARAVSALPPQPQGWPQAPRR